MTLTTPSLLFPAISLLLLAYTNRFLVLAQLIRQLHATDSSREADVVIPQIKNLRRRVVLIKTMQLLGVFSFMACTIAMLAMFLGSIILAKWVFGGSLLLLASSLLLSAWEIQISCVALDIELSDFEQNRS